MEKTTSQTEHRVLLSYCDSYRWQELEPALDAAFSGILTGENFNGKVVLLKPNLISGRGTSLACTNPHVIAAAAGYFLDRGARVKVGDSPAYGTARGVMEKHGMLAPLEGMTVDVVNFITPVERMLDNGVRVRVAAEALDCDLLVNLPKLKAHNQMYVTGAVKNMFGTVVGTRKAMHHMKNGGSHREFSEILLRLPDLFLPNIHAMDGIEVMHRSGPLDGDMLKIGCLGVSSCPVALDTAMLKLLDLPPENSPLWQAASEAGKSGASLTSHSYPLGSPGDFHGAGFLAPENLNPIRFNPFRFLRSAIQRFVLAIRS